jgi:hypothetical protein
MYALHEVLTKKGALIRIGYGAYARTRVSSVTGDLIPEKPLPDLANELLKKLEIKTLPTKAEVAYNKGESTLKTQGQRFRLIIFLLTHILKMNKTNKLALIVFC